MLAETIRLNFINRSGDQNNSSVVIFQQNVAEDFGEIAVAWKVIRNCGRLDNHPFTYSGQFEVCVSDSYGNYTPRIAAYDGDAYEMVLDNSGNVLRRAGTLAAAPDQVEIRNQLARGAINAHIYRDGRICATRTNLAPQQKAGFQLHPRLYIGVVSQVSEGQIMDAAIVSQINTEINLFGLTSADIVMTGGGPGPAATPFEFNLENINI